MHCHSVLTRFYGPVAALAADSELFYRLNQPPFNLTVGRHDQAPSQRPAVRHMAADAHKVPLLGATLTAFFRQQSTRETDRYEPDFDWTMAPVASRVFPDIPEPTPEAVASGNSRMMLVKAPGLGDFTEALEALAVERYRVPETTLYLLAELERPEKAALLLFTPFVDYVVLGRPVPSLSIFEAAYYRDTHTKAGYHLRHLDTILPMQDCELPTTHVPELNTLAEHPILEAPPALAEAALPALERLGLDPGRWYVCFHVRQTGYKPSDDFRPDHPRNILHVDRYEAAVRHVVEEHGGQVVILGDPGMTFSGALDRPGVIPLHRIADSLLLQLTALAGARFLVGTDSGPATLARAFNVPLLHSNVLNAGLGHWSPRAMSLTKTVWLAGRWVADREAEALDALGFEATDNARFGPDGLPIGERSAAELIAAVDTMLALTAPTPPAFIHPSIARPVNPGMTRRLGPDEGFPGYVADHPLYTSHPLVGGRAQI